MKRHSIAAVLLAVVLAIFAPVFAVQSSQRPAPPPPTDEQKLLDAMHLITDIKLYDYVKELCAEKYAGRLTGTPEYNACAEWVASLLKSWGVQPVGDKGTYLQAFPNPYSLVFKGGLLTMDIPAGKDVIKKAYRYEDEFIPGGTTAGGEVTAEVIFVGYGVTAPELGYDDYQGVDVKGKIVLMDPEVPDGGERYVGRLQEMAAVFVPSIQARERRRPRGEGHDLQLRADRQSQQFLPRRLRLPSRRGGRRGRRLRRDGPDLRRDRRRRSARISSRSRSPRARS